MTKPVSNTKIQLLIILIIILVMGGLSSIGVRLYLHAHPRSAVGQFSGAQQIVVTQWNVTFPTGIKNIDYVYQVPSQDPAAATQSINISTDRFSNATCTMTDGTTATDNLPVAVMYRSSTSSTSLGSVQTKTIGAYRYAYQLTSLPASCDLKGEAGAFRDAQNQFKNAFNQLAAN